MTELLKKVESAAKEALSDFDVDELCDASLAVKDCDSEFLSALKSHLKQQFLPLQILNLLAKLKKIVSLLKRFGLMDELPVS